MNHHQSSPALSNTFVTPPATMTMTTTTTTIATTESSNERQEGQEKRRILQARCNPRGGSKDSGGRRGRLWQLPQSSIQEYAVWIEEKPKETQTPSEQRFVQKFQRRMLIRQQKPPTETMKQYVARLEAKDNKSDVERQLIEKYHRRKANRRRLRNNPFRGSIIPPICWSREPCKKTPTESSRTVLSTMANLQENMNRMGLSSEKLRDMPMDDSPNPFPFSSHTNPFFS